MTTVFDKERNVVMTLLDLHLSEELDLECKDLENNINNWQELFDFLQNPILQETKVGKVLTNTIQQGNIHQFCNFLQTTDLINDSYNEAIEGIKDFLNKWDSLNFKPSPQAQKLFNNVYGLCNYEVTKGVI